MALQSNKSGEYYDVNLMLDGDGVYHQHCRNPRQHASEIVLSQFFMDILKAPLSNCAVECDSYVPINCQENPDKVMNAAGVATPEVWLSWFADFGGRKHAPLNKFELASISEDAEKQISCSLSYNDSGLQRRSNFAVVLPTETHSSAKLLHVASLIPTAEELTSSGLFDSEKQLEGEVLHDNMDLFALSTNQDAISTSQAESSEKFGLHFLPMAPSREISRDERQQVANHQPLGFHQYSDASVGKAECTMFDGTKFHKLLEETELPVGAPRKQPRQRICQTQEQKGATKVDSERNEKSQQIGTAQEIPSLERLKHLMKTSRTSQLLLQELDRLNGLPRSHSWTMTHSNRSRLQLQENRILPKWNGKLLIDEQGITFDAKRKKRRKLKHQSQTSMVDWC